MPKLKSKHYIEDSLTPRSEATLNNMAPDKDHRYAFTMRPTLSRLIKESTTCTEEFLKTKLLDICNQWNFDIISYTIEKDNHLHAILSKSDCVPVSYLQVNTSNHGWHCYFKRLATVKDLTRWESYIQKDLYKTNQFINDDDN